ncbi:hypothetical protein P691DRAFT_773487 [Macrolepiota fuliginosa MF-IS2]|uniref:Uncharacterized protein n=1 Tax=Macrolepiota fuliginosa MF-IS2 TaxID=1400762 RepID=A0A9P5XHG9_9AGAR|nr:hypothetical protein P691DRAFT_773487 [Macrolepiota fuliginosa MF-IS2]
MVVYRNQTYDDSDASFRYGGAYWHVEYWNVSTAVAGGKYHFSNAADAIVTFQFPVPAIAFHYYGLLRQDKNPGINKICADCNPNTNGTEINTGDSTGNVDPVNPQPILLYSERFDTAGIHTITLWNIPDPSISGAGSRISLDRFELEVDSATATQTSANPTSTSPTNSSNGSGVSVGALVGAIVGGNAVLFLLAFGLWFWWSRRQEKRKGPRPVFEVDSGGTVDPTAQFLRGSMALSTSSTAGYSSVPMSDYGMTLYSEMDASPPSYSASTSYTMGPRDMKRTSS